MQGLQCAFEDKQPKVREKRESEPLALTFRLDDVFR